MSRSSKGFADFFPTAPSVLQQKRSKTAQERKRRESPVVVSERSPAHVSSPSATNTIHGDSGSHSLSNGTKTEQAILDVTPVAQEETEPIQGDLLNGVGSASSTSTTSSVFSSNHPPLDTGRHGKISRTTLTPLTNDNPSPSGLNHSPAYSKQEPRSSLVTQASYKPVPYKGIQPSTMAADLDLSHHAQARPGNGELKGVRITYDPELDKSISSKERRSRKAIYKDILDDVSLSIFPQGILGVF